MELKLVYILMGLNIYTLYTTKNQTVYIVTTFIAHILYTEHKAHNRGGSASVETTGSPADWHAALYDVHK